MWRADAERSAALLAAFGALLVAATCSRQSRLEPARPAVEKPSVPSASPRSVASAAASAAAQPAPSAQPGALDAFYAALAGLETKTRKEHVRVVWLGDSHTAADYLTGTVRRRLDARFGAGGPGLVRVGGGPYRHSRVKVVREGRFRVEPEPPSRRTPEGDTAFGFEGLRATPLDSRARVEVRVDPGAARGTLRYELLFDLPRGASFRVGVGAKRTRVDAKAALEREPNTPIARLRFEGAPGETFEIGAMQGSPRFYGVLIEGSEPGVVLDTSGIDGARFATALAWNAEVFAAELAARSPELVVLAYGTNEAFDNRRSETYASEVTELVARIRRGVPRAACLLLGPPDAAAPDWTSLPRVGEIEAVLARTATRLGCGFFSLRAAMGGEGGFTRFLRESPALARSDRVHLLAPGYERLGGDVADFLIGGYAARPHRPIE